MAEKITYGISNLYYALKSTAAGVTSYGTPVPIPGAYEIALPPTGETVKIYADNITYVKALVNGGYDGNIGVYALPDSFYEDCLGQVKDSNGILVEAGNDVASEFALLGEIQTDTTQTKRFVLWNCSAGRPDLASATKEDSLSANQLSVPITATPVEGTEIIKGTIMGDASNATWANWFNAVPMPADASI